jgi:hypothetical protein
MLARSERPRARSARGRGARRHQQPSRQSDDQRLAGCRLIDIRLALRVSVSSTIAMTSIDRELSSSNIGPQRASRPVAGRHALRRPSDQPIASTDCQEERFLRRRRSGSARCRSHILGTGRSAAVTPTPPSTNSATQLPGRPKCDCMSYGVNDRRLTLLAIRSPVGEQAEAVVAVSRRRATRATGPPERSSGDRHPRISANLARPSGNQMAVCSGLIIGKNSS